MKDLEDKEQVHRVCNLQLLLPSMTNLYQVERYSLTMQTSWIPNSFRCLDFKGTAYLRHMTCLSVIVLAIRHQISMQEYQSLRTNSEENKCRCLDNVIASTLSHQAVFMALTRTVSKCAATLRRELGAADLHKETYLRNTWKTTLNGRIERSHSSKAITQRYQLMTNE